MNATQNIVVSALAPVILLTLGGWVAGRRRWITEAGVPGLTQLVFMLLTPALLFRTMSQVHVAELDFKPLAAYFAVVFLVFFASLALVRPRRLGAVIGLANTFSNTVMIGIPLITLAYGEQGLVTLFTVISLHSLLLLTTATLALEFAVAAEGEDAGGVLATTLSAVRNAILHPVPLPIIAGLAWGATGWQLPAVLDRTLAVAGQANGPMSLFLVGITLSHAQVGGQLLPALRLTAVKNLVMPALVAATGVFAFGLRGVPLAVIVVTAALPIGANVFLFSHRYGVGQSLITASVAVSTVAALGTVSGVLLLAQLLP